MAEVAEEVVEVVKVEAVGTLGYPSFVFSPSAHARAMYPTHRAFE